MEKEKKAKKKHEKYTKVRTLGQGAFGSAILSKGEDTGDLVVIKNIDMSSMTEAEQKAARKEAKIHEVLNHPNIVKFREVYITNKQKLCIVMDFADGKDLSVLIKKQQNDSIQAEKLCLLSEDEVLTKFTQICLAVKHLHDRNIIHRDLKDANVFLTKQGICKLGDLGVARVMNSTVSKANTICGTPTHMAPEILNIQINKNGDTYDKKCDIWSLGIILYQMCCLKTPFQGTSFLMMFKAIKKGVFEPLPPQFSPNMTHLIDALLNQNPEKRPKINQVLTYPILWDKVGGLLINDIFKNEFSKATLNNNVFQMRKEQAGNTDLHQSILKEFVKEYQPESGQKAEEFQEQYVNYIANLHNVGEVKVPELEASEYLFEQNSDFNSEMLAGTSEAEDSTYCWSESKNLTLGKSIKGGTYSKDDFVNVASLDWSSFSQYMIKNFGDIQFTTGFKLIEENYQQLIDEDDCEDKLADLIRHLNFENDEMLGLFVSNCTNYKFAQNMNY